MLTKINLLVCFLFLVCSSVAQEDSATVYFSNINGQEYFKRMIFTFNGKEIKVDNNKHPIPINTSAFDKIELGVGNKYASYAKFLKNHSYEIHMNPCSIFEIIAQQNQKYGSARAIVIDTSQTEYFFDCAQYMSTIKKVFCLNEFSARYTKKSYSAYCPHATIMMRISEVKDFNEDGKEFYRLAFNYLHGENVSIIYNAISGKAKVQIDHYRK